MSPAGNTIYVDTKTGVSELEAPEMTVSDMPFSDFVGKPSALSIFERMPPDFYEPLDKAFESAAFKNLADIRAESQEQVEALANSGTLYSLGMSRGEAEVLFSYTYEAKERKESPYSIMNRVLTERDDNKLRSHRGYILHLLKALRKLRPIDPRTTTLYRGTNGKYLKFDKEHYQEGNTMTWPAFTSTSTKEDVIYSFLERTTQPVIFEIHGAFVGYNIKDFSKFPNEDEILLEPETTFRIERIQNDTRDPKAKRIIVNVQPTPLMIKDAVENFAMAERNPSSVQTSQMLRNMNMSNPKQKQQQQPNNPVLPLNWEQRTDPKTGRVYYANLITKSTQWEFPAF